MTKRIGIIAPSGSPRGGAARAALVAVGAEVHMFDSDLPEGEEVTLSAEGARWKEAVGRAEFTGDADTASLKVSFFGPFFGGYHIVALDPDYRWSIVSGPSREYLWLLTREKQAPASLLDDLIEIAARLGFPTERLIRVEHRLNEKPAG